MGKDTRKGARMVVKVKKTFHGKVSVRDYLVKRAKRNGESLTIVYDNKRMVLPTDKLDSGMITAGPFTSKHNDKTYYLIDYDWIPTTGQEMLL